MTVKAQKTHTIAFYNIENLFDTRDNSATKDNDFLPFSKKRWTKKRYQNKLVKIGKVISEIGNEHNNLAPVIVGLAEVENKSVLQDLVSVGALKDDAYSFVHYDSSDERGIDVALLYKSDAFTVTASETFTVYLEDELGERDYTRDILLVQGELEGERLSILVNHWSSRREGVELTAYKRMAAAMRVNEIIASIHAEHPKEKIIVMGDFNDNPDDKSLLAIELGSMLFNPFKTVWSRDVGSLNHNFQWFLFDQILCSANILDPNNGAIKFDRAEVFNDKFLTQYHGKYQGQPFRTYVGKHYKGGYSDHFPVYIILKSS